MLSRLDVVRPAIVGGAFFALAACADGSDTTETAAAASARSPLIAAPLDTEHPFAVGVCQGVVNTDPAKGDVGACIAGTLRSTGTLVAPNLILTARHSVHIFDGGETSATLCRATFRKAPFYPGGTRITTAPSGFVGSPRWIEIADVVVSPDTDNLCEGDVALLILPENITDVEPAWVDLQRDVRVSPPSDGKVSIVGRGVIDRAVKPGTYETVRIDLGNLMRRYLRNVPFVCAGVGCTLPEFSAPPNTDFKLSAGQFAFAPSTLNGDSGSGVLLNESFESRPTVIGISSLGMWGADGECSGGVAARLEPHKSWIVKAVHEAAKRGNYRVPRWARL